MYCKCVCVLCGYIHMYIHIYLYIGSLSYLKYVPARALGSWACSRFPFTFNYAVNKKHLYISMYIYIYTHIPHIFIHTHPHTHTRECTNNVLSLFGENQYGTDLTGCTNTRSLSKAIGKTIYSLIILIQTLKNCIYTIFIKSDRGTESIGVEKAITIHTSI